MSSKVGHGEPGEQRRRAAWRRATSARVAAGRAGARPACVRAQAEAPLETGEDFDVGALPDSRRRLAPPRRRRPARTRRASATGSPTTTCSEPARPALWQRRPCHRAGRRKSERRAAAARRTRAAAAPPPGARRVRSPRRRDALLEIGRMSSIAIVHRRVLAVLGRAARAARAAAPRGVGLRASLALTWAEEPPAAPPTTPRRAVPLEQCAEHAVSVSGGRRELSTAGACSARIDQTPGRDRARAAAPRARSSVVACLPRLLSPPRRREAREQTARARGPAAAASGAGLDRRLREGVDHASWWR